MRLTFLQAQARHRLCRQTRCDPQDLLTPVRLSVSFNALAYSIAGVCHVIATNELYLQTASSDAVRKSGRTTIETKLDHVFEDFAQKQKMRLSGGL